MLNRYTFSGYRDGLTTVIATSEAEARHLAMIARWGPPQGIYTSPYHGLGLVLVAQEDSSLPSSWQRDARLYEAAGTNHLGGTAR